MCWTKQNTCWIIKFNTSYHHYTHKHLCTAVIMNKLASNTFTINEIIRIQNYFQKSKRSVNLLILLLLRQVRRRIITVDVFTDSLNWLTKYRCVPVNKSVNKYASHFIDTTVENENDPAIKTPFTSVYRILCACVFFY